MISSNGSILRSAGGMLFFRLAGQVLTFATIILIGRHLGPELFGRYATLLAIVSLAGVLLAPGLNELLVREAVNPVMRLSALRHGYAFRWILAIPAMLLVVMFSSIVLGGSISLDLAAIASLSLIFSFALPSVRYAYDVPLQLDYRLNLAALLNFLSRVIMLGLFALAVWAEFSLPGVIRMQAMGEITGVMIFAIVLWRLGYPLRPALKPGIFSAEFKLLLPIIMAELMTVTYSRVDVILLSRLAGEHQAGLYAGPMRMVDALMILPTVVLASASPVLNRLYQNNSRDFESGVRMLNRILWGAGILCAVMISPFGSQLAPLFFGQEWAESGSVLRWGAWAAPLVFAGTLWSLLMIVTNQQHLIFKVFLGMAVVNLTCNALLIPKLGADGAAISRIVTYASMFPLSLFWSGARHFGWTYNLQGLFPLLLAVSAGWGIQRLQIGLWWGLPLTGLVAAAGFWLTGWLGPARLRRFAQIFIHGEAVDRKE